ncbi:MAG: hypothetical protein KDB14_29190 [Planctomycetales bacterium]|nr:hypothetical protein [Planctomycetales bacterium]
MNAKINGQGCRTLAGDALPSRRVLLCSGLALMLSAPGCKYFQRHVELETPPPELFQQPPSLPELLGALNARSDRVLDLQTDMGHVTAPGFPRVPASLRMLRPRHMRLQANLLTRPVLDLGSNEERFWVWGAGEPVRFARHDQFANSAAATLLPVEPTWLMEAMGLIHFDPAGAHQGPFQREDGNIEVHTIVASSLGQRIRVVAIHPQYGYITEVQMRDARGGLLAIAKASRHRYFSEQQVTLPRRVSLDLVASQLPVKSFEFEAESYTVNLLHSVAAHPNLWAMPAGPSVDLAASGLQGVPLGAARSQPSQPSAQTANAEFHPQYRGYTQTR